MPLHGTRILRKVLSKKSKQESNEIHPQLVEERVESSNRLLRDAEEFVGAPRDGKRVRRQPNRYQALVAQVEEPSSFREEAQH